ncbi:MAG: hypothetical protein O6945_17770 [Gammaproteobacteria bacterium]|nr:hypothetical protein [Gammaproteobacteria bacterium]
MYGKIFDSMYDSTLADDWRALITFQQMIVLCDADGTVDMTPHSIARRTGIPIEHIEAGLKILEAPDPYSRTPDQEGRRIERLDDHRPWGWSIINHAYYRALKDAGTKRENNRIRKQRQREREKAAGECHGKSVTNCDRCDSHAKSRHTDTDTDTDTNNSASFDAFWDLYPRKVAKKKAQVAWKKLPLSKQELAIADIKTRYQGVNKQFIPHPTTYINGERWNDEINESGKEDSIFKQAERGMK